MPGDHGPSPAALDSPCNDASIYVNAVAATRVVSRLRDALALEGAGAAMTVGPVCVTGEPNDYVTGRRAHPFDFLEWPTVLECQAPEGAPAEEVVQAITAVLEALWHGGFKAVAACDFEEALPARGGLDRYPIPTAASGSGGAGASVSSWWKNLISLGKGKDRML
ncbi:hypothetical protein [Streptomyces sp. SID9727]|uniref:hypothetical protein n=1 Tax=Streptomyces sp. SID9727 TaxID=2706114 RepID=UPI0013C8A9C8|nr:hypothetical protein [Streptomyces sp. SID9727]NEC67692.1 hypothetical protein [Streptomyces sp. SID9727]